jgi:hypothetical protein
VKGTQLRPGRPRACPCPRCRLIAERLQTEEAYSPGLHPFKSLYPAAFCAGALREGMLQPLEEEGAGARPGTGIPTSPLMEHLSSFSISTELGQSDWRISPYETNPPSDEDETGEGPSCTSTIQKHGI